LACRSLGPGRAVASGRAVRTETLTGQAPSPGTFEESVTWLGGGR
jgi:hypothetical protein